VSGGSHNYLYSADLSWNSRNDDLEAMAARLEELGVPDAAEQTRALLAPELPQSSPLRDLWHAVEWTDSGDWGDDQLAEAVASWRGPAAPRCYVDGCTRQADESLRVRVGALDELHELKACREHAEILRWLAQL
jgi:hypothetical protein